MTDTTTGNLTWIAVPPGSEVRAHAGSSALIFAFEQLEDGTADVKAYLVGPLTEHADALPRIAGLLRQIAHHADLHAVEYAQNHAELTSSAEWIMARVSAGIVDRDEEDDNG